MQKDLKAIEANNKIVNEICNYLNSELEKMASDILKEHGELSDEDSAIYFLLKNISYHIRYKFLIKE